MAQRDLSRSAYQRAGQATRVEALADRARVARLVLEHRCAERLEPLDPVVEALDDQPLERRIPARALGPEALERPMAPDDDAREHHRASDAGALLEHERLRARVRPPPHGPPPRPPVVRPAMPAPATPRSAI